MHTEFREAGIARRRCQIPREAPNLSSRWNSVHTLCNSVSDLLASAWRKNHRPVQGMPRTREAHGRRQANRRMSEFLHLTHCGPTMPACAINSHNHALAWTVQRCVMVLSRHRTTDSLTTEPMGTSVPGGGAVDAMSPPRPGTLGIVSTSHRSPRSAALLKSTGSLRVGFTVTSITKAPIQLLGITTVPGVRFGVGNGSGIVAFGKVALCWWAYMSGRTALAGSFMALLAHAAIRSRSSCVSLAVFTIVAMLTFPVNSNFDGLSAIYCNRFCWSIRALRRFAQNASTS